MRRRVLMAMVASALTGLTLAVAPASPAMAISYCNTEVAVYMGQKNLWAYQPGVNGSYKCYLFKGDGPDDGVRSLQRAINACYIDRGYISRARLVVDGEFGTNTKAALVAVQNYLHINADGGYGPQTHNAMSFPGAPSGICWPGSNVPW